MKAKHLLIASAVLLSMAACNNDALETVNDPTQVENSDEITGATLLSKGATLVVDMDGVSASRMGTDGIFNEKDKLGLGWFNAATTSNGSIKDIQATNWTEVKVADENIYANHVFQKTDQWSSFANIYQGAHFAYFPYVHTDKVKTMEFELKNIQTTLNENEPFNEGLQLSPKLLMSTEDVQNSTLTMNINLFKMHNTLKFTISGSNLSNDETIETITVSYTSTNETNSFVTKVKLNPHKLPATVYANETDKTLNKEANKQAMRNASELFGLTTNSSDAAFTSVVSSNTVTTECKANLTLASNPTLYINLFPGQKVEGVESTVTLKTNKKEYTFNNLENLNKFLTNGFGGKGISTLSNEFLIPLNL